MSSGRPGVVAVSQLLLLLLIMASSVRVQASLLRPSTVHFAFVHNVDDQYFRYDATQLFAGLKMAEMFVNKNDLLHGTNLTFDFFAAPSLHSGPSAILSNLSLIAANESVVGLVLGDWFTTPRMYQIANGTMPVIGARSATSTEFQNALFPFVQSWRAPLASQHRPMLRHAMGASSTQYSYFAVVFRSSLFPNAATDVSTTLSNLGWDAPLALDADLYLRPNGTIDTAALQQAWIASSSDAYPLCGLFFLFHDDIVDVLASISVDTHFDFGHMTFYAADLSGEPFRHPILGTAPFARLFSVKDFTDPITPDHPTASQYRSMLAASEWNASTEVLQLAQLTGVAVDTTPNFVSFEGFSIGMMIAGFLESMPSISRSDYLTNLYRVGVTYVGDDVIGPFTNRCLRSNVTDFACHCNVGSSTQTIAGVDVASGRLSGAKTGGSTTRYSQLVLPYSQCVSADANLISPVHFQLFAPLDASPTALQVWFAQIFSGLQIRGAEVNAAGVLTNSDFSTAYMNTLVNTSAAVADLQGTLLRLNKQRRPFFLMGNWWGASELNLPIINLNFGPTTLLTDPPLAAPTAFTKFTWTFKPTLADLLHTVAFHIAHQASLKGNVNPSVLVLATTAEAVGLAVRSLHTAQLPVSAVSILNATTAISIVAALREVFSGASNTGSDTALVFASVLDAEVTAFLSALATVVTETTQTMPAEAATQLFSRMSVSIATDQVNLYYAKLRLLTRASALSRVPLYFGSYLPPFFEPTNSQRLDVMKLFNTTSLVITEAVTQHAIDLLVVVFTNALQKVTSLRPTPEEVLDVIYAEGVVTANGITFGPFFTDSCTADVIDRNEPDRSCQCMKAIRTFPVYDFRGWLLNNASLNPHFSYEMTSCGPAYKPLLEASSLNVPLIAGLASAGGVLIATACIYFIFFYGRRSNRHAPQDPDQPFAMVFTDIQNSTALWARVPEAMAAALETHHAVLRQLIDQTGGYEVKTIGDSFMVAFKSASKAAEFALRIQTTLFDTSWPVEIDETYIALSQEAWEDKMGAIEAERLMSASGSSGEATAFAATGGASAAAASPSKFEELVDMRAQWTDMTVYARNWNGIRVRVGLHWGLGSVKFDPVAQGYDYYGTLVNTAARVEGVGNGGQVLMTKDMFDAIMAESFDTRNVSVEALGPQPLRGLDRPVPLYQVSPTALASRSFNPLRLDVEIDVDDDSESSKPSGDTSTEETWESMLDKLIRRSKEGIANREFILRAVNFVHTALKAMPQSWRKDVLKDLAKKWHLKLRRAPKHEPYDKTMMFDIATVTYKIASAADVARKAALRAAASEFGASASDGAAPAGCSTTRRASSLMPSGQRATSYFEVLDRANTSLTS